jgi:hypothetical protein
MGTRACRLGVIASPAAAFGRLRTTTAAHQPPEAARRKGSRLALTNPIISLG